tara:strand:+ start:24 stop:620 length:597 start_codon:yes stop_codon:yes gene_type:complete
MAAYTANASEILSTVNNPNFGSVYNYLRPNAFKFVIKDLPHVAYTCQSANLPSLNLGFAVQPSPFLDIPRIGDKINYSEFTIRFLISEDMVNYRELLEWLVALGFPNSYTEYPGFVGERLNRFPFINNAVIGQTETAAYSDGTLTILDSSNNPKTLITFRNLFPIAVEALDFDITSSAVEFFVGIATFKYNTFEIEAL